MKHLSLLAVFVAALFTMSCCKEGFPGKKELDLSLLYGEWQDYTNLHWYWAHTYTFSSDGTYHSHLIDKTAYTYEDDEDGTYRIVKSKDGTTILMDPGNDTMAYIITYLSADEMEWELWGTANPDKRHFFKVKK